MEEEWEGEKRRQRGQQCHDEWNGYSQGAMPAAEMLKGTPSRTVVYLRDVQEHNRKGHLYLHLESDGRMVRILNFATTFTEKGFQPLTVDGFPEEGVPVMEPENEEGAARFVRNQLKACAGVQQNMAAKPTVQKDDPPSVEQTDATEVEPLVYTEDDYIY